MTTEDFKPKKVDVGWYIEEPIGKFVFHKPEPLFRERLKPLSNRAVQACPAVNELERDLFVIKNAFDIRLRCKKRDNIYDLHIVEEGTRIDDDLIPRFVFLMAPKFWRAEDKPVIQIKIPYFFLADEPCYMTQTSPHMNSNARKWPGMLISGRFPINVWPRIMNWAFEWDDLSEDLILRRNDPLCYLYFETANLRTKANLFEIENTPELEEYRKGLAAVPKFVSNTFSLFETALERRPKQLLKKKLK
tara:strand:- start:958 stop:1698 length:741 start_codon:yes stop_codon:yes gene_type:complete